MQRLSKLNGVVSEQVDEPGLLLKWNNIEPSQTEQSRVGEMV